MKKLFVKTYGCQMNVYDSDRMSDVLAPHGYVATDRAEEADLIVLNTCHIREKAAEKVYSEIGRMRRIGETRGGGKPLLAVAGCVAQAEGKEIIRRAPAVGLVFGPQVYHRLPQLVARAQNGEAVVETEFPAEDKFDHLPRAVPKQGAARGKTAFLTVQEGCDKFCSFCVVPYTRGAEASRPLDAVLAEARDLVAAGVCEISLLGQNVNAYHGARHGAKPGGGTASLAGLIEALALIDGLERIRYTTSHPRDMSEDLIAAHRDIDKLMPYLHLPIQSGSDRILAAMNRQHTARQYLDIIERLRTVRPDLAVSSDFIVGFPGESEEDFAATLCIVKEVGYAQAYSFKYSPRPGTPGAALPEQVEEAVKAERLARLQERINAGQRSFNAACVGRPMQVLLDRKGRKQGQLAGRSPYLQAVQVDAPVKMLDTLQWVTIEAAGPNSLFGCLDRGAAAHGMGDGSIGGSGDRSSHVRTAAPMPQSMEDAPL